MENNVLLSDRVLEERLVLQVKYEVKLHVRPLVGLCVKPNMKKSARMSTERVREERAAHLKCPR